MNAGHKAAKAVRQARKRFVQASGIAEIDRQFLAPGRTRKEAKSGAGKPGRRTRKLAPEEAQARAAAGLMYAAAPIMKAELAELRTRVVGLDKSTEKDKTHMLVRALTLPPLPLLCPKDDVVAATARHMATAPKQRDKEAAGKLLMQTAAHVVRAMAQAALAKIALASLEEIAETYLAINGERPTEPGEPQDSYDSGLDDLVEALFSDDNTSTLLGPGWLGVNTIDTRVELPARRKEISDSYGITLANAALSTLPEVTDAKILSAAGLVAADLEYLLDGLDKGKPMASLLTDQDYANAWGTVSFIINHNKDKLDITELMSELEQAGDSDRILANSSITRLGFQATDDVYGAFKIMSSVGKHWIADAVKGQQPHPLNLPPVLNVPEDKRAEARERHAAEQKEKRREADTSGGGLAEGISAQDAVEVCTTLKECGCGDKELSEALGISRATLNNYTNGKTAWKPTTAQVGTLRTLCQTKINALGFALTNL